MILPSHIDSRMHSHISTSNRSTLALLKVWPRQWSLSQKNPPIDIIHCKARSKTSLSPISWMACLGKHCGVPSGSLLPSLLGTWASQLACRRPEASARPGLTPASSEPQPLRGIFLVSHVFDWSSVLLIATALWRASISKLVGDLLRERGRSASYSVAGRSIASATTHSLAHAPPNGPRARTGAGCPGRRPAAVAAPQRPKPSRLPGRQKNNAWIKTPPKAPGWVDGDVAFASPRANAGNSGPCCCWCE